MPAIDRPLSDCRYWRERKAGMTIDAQSAAEGVNAYEQANEYLWSWGVELLSRGEPTHLVYQSCGMCITLSWRICWGRLDSLGGA